MKRAAAGAGRPRARPARAAPRPAAGAPSPPTSATSCTPIGSPAPFWCSGSEIAGWPALVEDRREDPERHRVRVARERILGRPREVAERRRRRRAGGREQQVEAALPPARDAAHVRLIRLDRGQVLHGGDGAAQLGERPGERLDVALLDRGADLRAPGLEGAGGRAHHDRHEAAHAVGLVERGGVRFLDVVPERLELLGRRRRRSATVRVRARPRAARAA